MSLLTAEYIPKNRAGDSNLVDIKARVLGRDILVDTLIQFNTLNLLPPRQVANVRHQPWWREGQILLAEGGESTGVVEGGQIIQVVQGEEINMVLHKWHN